MTAENIKMLVLGASYEIRDKLEKIFLDSSNIAAKFVATQELAEEMAEKFQPNILLIGDHVSDAVWNDVIVSIRIESDSVKSIILASQLTQGLLRKALLAGVNDIVEVANLEHKLLPAIHEVMARNTNEYITIDGHLNNHLSHAKVIVVSGAHGGSGKTTIAVNLAVALANKGKQVLLVDCDFNFGHVSSHLTLSSQITITDCIAAMETQSLTTLVNDHDSGLKVLLAPRLLDHSEELNYDKVVSVLNAYNDFDYIVADTDTRLNDLIVGLLDVANLTLLVTTLSPPALEDVYSIVHLIETMQWRTHIVLNQITSLPHSEADNSAIKQLEKKLHKKVSTSFVFDRTTLLEAVNKQIPAVMYNPESQFAEEMHRLADAICELLKEKQP